jgi:hypothetical protein
VATFIGAVLLVLFLPLSILASSLVLVVGKILD